jgi:selenide,water dikinase
MGGRPLFALNVVGWPVGKLPMEQLGEVLRGGAETAQLAGASILGGHSIDDPEPKYGLAVTGLVHPDRILRNVGARPGDALVLTKPLGSGIATTAIKRELATPALLERVTELMAALNRAAGEVLAESGGVHALTDITGFGLLGHGWEMASGSGVGIRFHTEAIRVLDGIHDLAAKDVVPGGSKANLRWVTPHLRLADGLAPTWPTVLADAQTNGGLLAAVDLGHAADVVAALRSAGVADAAIVGEVLDLEPRLEVR